MRDWLPPVAMLALWSIPNRGGPPRMGAPA
ncbi:hypothetical protein VT85_01990 [Planctomyces sp. SH-PL62]|nr:hypothetical protein VT85_01990 [Planctomyces sp. SH-PL62]